MTKKVYKMLRRGSSLGLSGEKHLVLNAPEDMAWLRRVYLPLLAKRYKSAVLYGDEQRPYHIDCYMNKHPLIYYDFPQVWVLETEEPKK